MKPLLNLPFCLLVTSVLTAQSPPKIFINEFLASNVSVNADMVDFDDYSDWIELYNDENYDVDISGYFITDDRNNPYRWEFPEGVLIGAKGFLLIWADGYDSKGPGNHTTRPWIDWCSSDPLNQTIWFNPDYYHLDFKLSRAGEFIGLYTPNGLVVDSVRFDLQYRDVSMGRKPDGSPDWHFFGEPTPAASNNTEGLTNTEFTGEPDILPESGFYSGSNVIALDPDDPEASLTYTLNGSKPGSASLTYADPLAISETTVLRTRQFEDGKLPGTTLSRTYFIDESITLPVISIITPPDVLWDEMYGIYDNRLKLREVPVSFEFFPTNGPPALRLDAGLRLTGEQSLCYNQISFTITARDRYGSDNFNYPFFPERELNDFKSIYLRNSGVPDHQSTYMRDALMHTLVLKKMDLDCQAYRPSVVFLNGEYWGIYNIRDKISKEYIGSLHNINPDDIDLLEYEQGEGSTPVIMDGNGEDYSAFYTFIDNADMSVETNYRKAEGWMDIDEFINYQICEIYCDNVFWPDQNMRMWRERKEGRKWRWILHDTDFGFGMPNQLSSGVSNNTLAWATSTADGFFNPPDWSTRIFTRLLKNEEFRTRFIQYFAGYLNTAFHPDTVIEIIDRISSGISPEMNRQIQRWKDENSSNGAPIQSYAAWLNNVQVLRAFARNRPRYLRQDIIDFFGLPGTAVLKLEIESAGTGRVEINEVEAHDTSSTGIYFKDIPVDLEAKPKVGYRFVRWEGAASDTLNRISIVPSADTLQLTAVFEAIDISIVPDTITADTTLSLSDSPWYATGDIIVDSNTTLTVEAGVELRMPEEACIIVYGRLLVEGTEQEPVSITPNEYTEKWGALCFVDATDSSSIANLKIEGATLGHHYTRDRAAVSGYNSDFSLEGVSMEEVQRPIFIQYGNVAIRNCTLYTEEAGDLINVKKASSVIVENCDLLGSDGFDSDAIDYDQLSGGIIRGNRIRNFYGFNSDAIDLGEGSHDILIEDNIIYNINDKGVSVGKGSEAVIRRNIIANCAEGIGVKDFGSYAYSEHNTFYSNQYGIASFVKNIGEGGGNTDVVNCIVANSKSLAVMKDDLSVASISYSLSNTGELNGLHNIECDPLFLNNLRLDEGSPAINSGNPSLPSDPDGSDPDMGALPYDPGDRENMIINEIHYNPAAGASYQFIELLNAGTTAVNLNGYELDGNINLTFSDIIVAPDELLVVGMDQSIYQGQGFDILQWDNGDLNQFPGSVLLRNDQGKMIDYVDYHKRHWWPKEPDGQGPSLELYAPTLENMVSTSWRSSYADGGTPGRSNNSIEIEGIFINEVLASNHDSYADEFGEFDDWLEFYNSNDYPVNMGGLYITDNLNNPMKHQVPQYDADQTTIPAKGFLLFWADGSPEQGILHLGYQFDRLGEQMGLAQVLEDHTVYLDSMSYTEQQTDISFGRYTDGTDHWDILLPTPLMHNQLLPEGLDEVEIPESLSDLWNYPNPFRSETVVSYKLLVTGYVEINICDFMGRKVSTLIHEKLPEGSHEVTWEAAGFKPGIYFCELKTTNNRVVQKMVLLK